MSQVYLKKFKHIMGTDFKVLVRLALEYSKLCVRLADHLTSLTL